MKRRSGLLTALVFGGLVLLLAVVPAAAGDTVGEIIAMLEGDLSEALILDWLAAGDEALERPTAAQLLELKQAGASEELLHELVRRSRSAATSLPAEVSPSPTAETLRPAVSESVPAKSELEPRVPGGLSVVRFRLLYSPRFDEDEEPWDLMVYLDGQPLSHVPASSEMLGLTPGEPLELEIELPSGSHMLRVFQERHWQRRRGWRHAARVSEATFTFEVARDAEAKVDVEFRQGWGDLTDPLTFRFTQGDRVADLEEVGSDPEHWPELCEDAGRQPPRDDCVGWASLWSGDAVPSRAEVLAALARFEYRPVPR